MTRSPLADPNPGFGDSSPRGLSLWPGEACLLTELVRELRLSPPESWRHVALVLPTQRLSTWVLASLSQNVAAFVPPQTYNLESLIRSLYQEWSPCPPEAVLSDLEAELIMAGLLRRHSYRHLRLGHEHEILQFFSELHDWGLTAQAFSALKNAVRDNIYLAPGAVDSLSERVVELEDLFGAWNQTTKDLGRHLKSAVLAAESAFLTEYLTRAPWDGPDLYIVGFTSAKAANAQLLRALARQDTTRLWVSEAPDLVGGKNPLLQLIQSIGLPATRRTPGAMAPESKRLQVLTTPSILSEIAAALDLAEMATREGIPPSLMAILVSDEGTYGKPLRALLKKAKVRCNLALSTPLAETPLGVWLHALFTLLKGQESITEILNFLAHPITLSGSDVTRADLYRAAEAAQVSDGFANFRASPTLPPRVRLFLEATFQKLRPFTECTAGGRAPFATWAAALTGIIEPALAILEDPAADVQAPEDEGTARETRPALSKAMATSLRETVLRVLDSWAAVAPLMDSQIDRQMGAADFIMQVAPRLLGEECRDIGEPLRGVQVLSIEEARYVPFAKVIILGAVEGKFPRALPKDHVLDHYLKTKIGLPGWHFLEAIEDTTYHLLRARLGDLTLLYPHQHGSTPTVRSRFIEAALTLGEGVLTRIEAVSPLTDRLRGPGEAPLPELDPASQEAGIYDGSREDLLLTASASSVTSLIQCPYRFLLDRLKVAPLKLKAADDPKDEGDWLHQVLEAFFTGMAGGRILAPPLRLEWGDGSADLAQFRPYALERLRQLTAALAPRETHEAPLRLHLEWHAWPAFVDHLLKTHGGTGWPRGSGLKALAASRHETRFGGATPLKVQVGTHQVSLRGTIDRVDTLGPIHVVTDYKRQGSPSRRQVMLGLSPQLMIYSLALEQGPDRLERERTVVGYWSILQGVWTPIASGPEARDLAKEMGLLTPRDQTCLTQGISETLGLWQWRLDALLHEKRPFAPDPSECGYCPYSSVCRRDDPELGPTVAKGKRLADLLRSAAESSSQKGVKTHDP